MRRPPEHRDVAVRGLGIQHLGGVRVFRLGLDRAVLMLLCFFGPLESCSICIRTWVGSHELLQPFHHPARKDSGGFGVAFNVTVPGSEVQEPSLGRARITEHD